MSRDSRSPGPLLIVAGRHVLETLISTTSLMIWISIVATFLTKGMHGVEQGIISLFSMPRVVGVDLLVFGLVALIVDALIARWPRALLPLGVVIATLLMTLVLLNCFFLLETGEQGSWYELVDAIKRLQDLKMVLEDISSPSLLAAVGMGFTTLFGMCYAARRWAGIRGSAKAQVRAGRRIRVWLVLVALGLSMTLGFQSRDLQESVLRKNVVVLVIKTAWSHAISGSFERFSQVSPIDVGSLEASAQKSKRPNVVIFFLESTRFDHTALAGEDALAQTPVISTLAQTGAVAGQMRAVLPHTTKSIFSMLCGQYPTLQRSKVEASTRGNASCLPGLLRDAGYATLFAQSAFGTFESRPQLVRNFGYEEFAAYEDIKGEKVSYLSSDDGSLHTFFSGWLARRKVEGSTAPFLATFLTSATHHSYKLPKKVKTRAKRLRRPHRSSRARYARLVESEDALIGRIRSELQARHLWSNTVLVIVGDHGEGFGDHGVKQHDNNYFEEGLRVPFLMTGPGIEPMRVEHASTLIDFLPTVAAALGLELADDANLPGHDVFDSDYPSAAAKFFSCYKSHRCAGFVKGHLKYVEVPRDDEAFVIDLRSDPKERKPQLVPPELDADIRELHRLLESKRYEGLRHDFAKGDFFSRWRCDQKGKCLHPGAWKKKYRWDPSGKLNPKP